jgi:hypothetical protein
VKLKISAKTLTIGDVIAAEELPPKPTNRQTAEFLARFMIDEETGNRVPIEDAKIPTFTQQSLPPVVAPVNQEQPVAISNSAVAPTNNSSNQQEILPNNSLINEDKPKKIADSPSTESLPEAKSANNETKPKFFKKLLSKQSTAPQNTNTTESIQNEALNTQSVPEKSAEVLQNSQEKLPEKLPEKLQI